jgi:hypothetical protein
MQTLMLFANVSPDGFMAGRRATSDSWSMTRRWTAR